MMKKLLTALLVALAVVLLMAVIMLFFPRGGRDSADESSAEDSLASTEMLVIPSDMPEGITMKMPEGFSETSSQYYKKYYVKDDASVIITGEDLTFKINQIDPYTKSVIEQYKESVDEFELLEDEVITVSGTRAHLLEFSYAIVGEDARQDFKCTTAVMIYDEQAYLVTCKCHAENYQNYREVFRMAMSTIQLTGTAKETDVQVQEITEPAAEIPAETAAPAETKPEDSVQP